MSVRAGDLVAITPSGISYAEMRPEDVCLVHLDGTEPREGNQETPSSETPMHLAIYAATTAAAVVHTHSPEVVALSASRPELPAIHYAITGLGGPVRVAPYVRFGSEGLAAAAVEALDGRSAVILRNHGAVTYGRDLAQAYDRALLLEWLARTYRLALSYGEPSILSAAELDEVTAESRRRRYGERRSGQPCSAAHHERARRRLAAGHRDRARRAHPGRAGAAGRDDTARPGQRPAARDPGHRRGHGRRDRRRPGQAGRPGARRRRARRRPARRHRDRRDGQARRRHRRADPQGGAQTSATILPIRPNGERPAFHVPGATRLFTRADIDLERMRDSRALLIGAPDALAGMTGEELAQVAGAARSNGALVAVDVLHPGRPEDFERLAPLLAVTDWFMPNGDQILALTGRTEPRRRHQGRAGARAPAAWR